MIPQEDLCACCCSVQVIGEPSSSSVKAILLRKQFRGLSVKAPVGVGTSFTISTLLLLDMDDTVLQRVAADLVSQATVPGLVTQIAKLGDLRPKQV